jgi:hypothetical protein
MVEQQSEEILHGTPVTGVDSVGVVHVTTCFALCSGVLLTNNWVLTNDHCINNSETGMACQPGTIRVTHSEDTGLQEYWGQTVSSAAPYDAALVRLNRPASFNGGTQTINNALSVYDWSKYVGQTVDCYGYGYDDNHGSGNEDDWTGSGARRVGTFTVQDLDPNYPEFMRVPRNTLDQMGFHGDSGGPCFYNYGGVRHLAGIWRGHENVADRSQDDVNPTMGYIVRGDLIRDWADRSMFSGLTYLGGQAGFSPGIAHRGPGSLQVVRRENDGVPSESRKNEPYAWTIWKRLNGVIAGRPELVSTQWGSLVYLIVKGMDRAVWYKIQTDGTWEGDWHSIGGVVLSYPGAVYTKVGRDESVWVFAIGTDYAMWYNRITGGVPSGWASLGGSFGTLCSPAAVSPSTGVVWLYALDGSGVLKTRSWSHVVGWYDAWTSVSTPYANSCPTVTSSAPGRIDLFVASNYGKSWLYYKKRQNNWQPTWNNLGWYTYGQPAATSWGTGRMDVVYKDASSNLQHFSWGG